MTSASTNGAPVIEVIDLVKRYGEITAVDGITFSVDHGEIFGMLGPNGAGKTTTVEVLEGLRELDEGQAFVNGIDVTRDPQSVKAIIGVQLQQNAFFERLTLAETVDLFAALYGSDVDSDEVLDQVGLLERKKANYKELSGGQKQRLSIAVALVNDPVAMFLDEPTTGLDPQARRNLWGLITVLRQKGMAIMLTTHYMEEAQELCDRVAIIDQGKIVAMDTPTQLVNDLKESGVESDRRDGTLTLEDVFIHLTGRRLQE